MKSIMYASIRVPEKWPSKSNGTIRIRFLIATSKTSNDSMLKAQSVPVL